MTRPSAAAGPGAGAHPSDASQSQRPDPRRPDPRWPDKPWRILLVHNAYRFRGGEDTVFEAERDLLLARGHDLEVLRVENEDLDDGKKLRMARDAVWSPGGARAVRAACERHRPHVVHVHNTLPRLSPAAFRAAHRSHGAAVVHTLHNYRMVCPGALLFRDGEVCEQCIGKKLALPGIKHGCYRGSRPATAAVAAMLAVHRMMGTWRNDVDAYLALTDFARDKILAGGMLPADRVTVLPNFLSEDPLQDRSADVSRSGRTGFVYVGRLTPEKGIRTLLDAYRRTAGAADDPSRSRFDEPLNIVGEGPLEDQVRAAAQADPRIHYHGLQPRDVVLNHVKSARALVIPSTWYEGFPMTVVEAFGCGTPVLASNLGSLGAVVTDRETGLLFPPGDDEALATVLREAAAGDTAAELGRNARMEFEQSFTADAHGDALEALYAAAIARRHGAQIDLPTTLATNNARAAEPTTEEVGGRASPTA